MQVRPAEWLSGYGVMESLNREVLGLNPTGAGFVSLSKTR